MNIFPMESQRDSASVNATCVGRVSRPVQTKFGQDGTGVASCGFVPKLLSVVAMLFIALTGVAKADSIQATVTSKTSNTTVQVAEPFTLEITVDAPTGSKVDFPSIGASLGSFDVTDQVDRADVPSANETTQRTWTRQLTLESIITGDLEIPSLEILVREGNGVTQTLKSETMTIHVKSVLEDRADPTKFRDIQSVVDIDVPQPVSHAWMWWTLGGVGGVLAAALMLVAVSRRKTWMTPNTWALRELDQLRNSAAMQSSNSEIVTENLTTVLRDYLDLQFNIATPVQTTSELLHEIETCKLMSADAVKGYATLFENADLARFAGLTLSQAELTKCVDDAAELIEQTTSEIKHATGQ